MNERQKKLIEFAELILDSLEAEREWGADLTDDIGVLAMDLDLGQCNDEGFFEKTKEIS
jgi:hypothetical protein